MTISRLLSPVLSKSFFSLLISLLLSACSTGENFTEDTGGGLAQGAAQGVALSWIAPAEREDGTPISMAEIAGYRVYYGTSEGVYPNEVDISDGNTMQATLSNLAAGTYYMVVTTYDVDGRESAFSDMVTRNI